MKIASHTPSEAEEILYSIILEAHHIRRLKQQLKAASELIQTLEQRLEEVKQQAQDT